MNEFYTRVEIFSGPDEQGRYGHFRYWMSDYHPGHPKGEYRTAERGQVHFSALPDCEATRACLAAISGEK